MTKKKVNVCKSFAKWAQSPDPRIRAAAAKLAAKYCPKGCRIAGTVVEVIK